MLRMLPDVCLHRSMDNLVTETLAEILRQNMIQLVIIQGFEFPLSICFHF